MRFSTALLAFSMALLAAAGARVTVTGRDPQQSDDGIDVAALDVHDDASVGRVVDGVVARCGRLDILVANAGVYRDAPVLDAACRARGRGRTGRTTRGGSWRGS